MTISDFRQVISGQLRGWAGLGCPGSQSGWARPGWAGLARLPAEAGLPRQQDWAGLGWPGQLGWEARLGWAGLAELSEPWQGVVK